jgi:signal transduction histidine kinase
VVVDQQNLDLGHRWNGSGRYRAYVSHPSPLDRIASLIEGAAAVVGEADLENLLRRLVAEARTVTGARYAALGVIGDHGVLSDFIYEGIEVEQAKAIGHLPSGKGVLGTLIRENATLVLDTLGDHPDSVGFPEHHPQMSSFLGVPVAVGKQAFGNLYLTDKDGGFTDEDVVVVEALSRIAGAAVQTARLQGRLRALAVMEERQRIARDLHDSVIQDLFAVGLGLQSLATRMEDEGTARLLDDSVDRLDHSVDSLRGYIFDLKGSPHPVPVADRIQDLVARMGSAYPTKVRLTVEGDGDFPQRHHEDLMMLATEALSNALRHSRADLVEVLLADGADVVILEVSDDGVGMAEEEQVSGPGMGLANMRTRAAAMGGRLLVESVPGKGTRVRVTLPRRRPN